MGLATMGSGIAVVLAAGAACGQTCDAIPTFADGLTPSRVLHVAPGGSNATGTGSASNPYATISHAAGLATPGTRVLVHAGTYAGGGFLNNVRGTATAPIWIGGDGTMPLPVIEGGSEGLHLVRPRYVVLENLEVRGASSNGINCDDGGEYANPDAARFLVFRRLWIHDIGGTGNQDGLKLSGVNDFVVLDAAISRCGGANSGSGIDMVGCHRGVIARSTFSELSGNAVQAKGGSEDVEVRRCTMTDAGQRAVNLGGSTGFEFFRPPLSATQPNFEARNIRVVSSVIIGSEAPAAYVGCVGCVVANNTIITPHSWVVRILQETVTSGGYTFLPASGGRFVNNIVYFDRWDLSTFVNVGANTSPQTFVFGNNLWYARDNPAASAPTLPTPETGGIVGLDPRFVDAAFGYYLLRWESPARRTGASPGPSGGDRNGICYASPPSLGAHQFCYANCDTTAGLIYLAVSDFVCFNNQFAAGSPYANCDESTSPPVLNILDFVCFIERFARGCP